MTKPSKPAWDADIEAALGESHRLAQSLSVSPEELAARIDALAKEAEVNAQKSRSSAEQAKHPVHEKPLNDLKRNVFRITR